LERLLLPVLARLGCYLCPQDLAERLDIERAQQVTDRGRADVRAKGGVAFLAGLLAQLNELVLVEELRRLYLLITGFNDYVRRVIDDLLEVTQRHAEQISHLRGQRLEEPDVRNGHGQLDMAHSLAA